MMHARSLRRIALILAHLGAGATLALYIGVRSRFGRRPPRVPAMTSRWHRRLCEILGIRICVAGRPEPGCLLVGNHISWLDIPVVGAQGEIGFLSKAEVRDWPLIGWLAETAGTLFIERGAIRIQEISVVLRRGIGPGQTLMLFPEGTTSDGTSVLRFHPRLFALARENGLGIQPVALAYRRDGGATPDTVAPFIGDDTLLAHLLRVIRHPGLVAEIRFLPPVPHTEAAPRRILAERTRGAILDALGMDPDASPHDPTGTNPDSSPDATRARPDFIATGVIARVA
jgi:1-acyl-sn-glycerol-3-phosphate acyltransferase